jgi:CBS domain containing-hemolysin-like protein
MITLEDIEEEVVGEFVGVGYNIPGYVHREKRVVEALDEDTYLVDARLSLGEINDILDTSLSTKEAHTIGGLLMARLRHIPRVGETISDSGYRFSVEEATGKMVRKVRIEVE